MPKQNFIETAPPSERALLVGVHIRGNVAHLSMEESLSELGLLADTAGVRPVGEISQTLNTPNVKTFIGPGKVEEIQALLEELDAHVVIFDDELSPRHQRELEKILGEKIKLIDRTALILDIFAQHANTHEGSLQVELAQYEYRLPRLTRAWTHLARQAGGRAGAGVGLRGPGETQLESDRRQIRERIDILKEELEKVRAHRSRHRERRKKSRIPVVALVGYTNAGKSTLLNRIAQANVYVANQLFATLDPTTRRVELPGGKLALFSDTVGFIQKLPTTLVAAFRATLEEITEAELLLHVIDVTHPEAQAQAESVMDTLKEIEADHIPILTVLNKIDRFDDPDQTKELLVGDKDAIAVSALKGIGIEELLLGVSRKLYETQTAIEINLPYKEGALLALFHEQGQIDTIEHQRKGVYIKGRLPGRLVARFKPYQVTDNLIEDDEEIENAG
ncbi:MAG: GTPase HflX [Anaerolineales bacterium]|nr:GTPase HflX [Anaerolineales bacterium]